MKVIFKDLKHGEVKLVPENDFTAPVLDAPEVGSPLLIQASAFFSGMEYGASNPITPAVLKPQRR